MAFRRGADGDDLPGFLNKAVPAGPPFPFKGFVAPPWECRWCKQTVVPVGSYRVCPKCDR